FRSSNIMKLNIKTKELTEGTLPLLDGEPFRQTGARPLHTIIPPLQGFVNDRLKAGRCIKGSCYIKWILPEDLLDASSQHLWRVSIHHAHRNSVFPHTGGFPDNLHGIFIVFESSNKGKRIEGMVFERHIMRIGHYQIAFKKMNGLRKHERRYIATRCFYPNFFPPPGEACGSTSELQQRLNPLVGSYKLFHYSFLPDFSPLIAAFVPLLISIGVLSVEKPFFTPLPVLLMAWDQCVMCAFNLHFFINKKCPNMP